jgi:hypothetical protein
MDASKIRFQSYPMTKAGSRWIADGLIPGEIRNDRTNQSFAMNTSSNIPKDGLNRRSFFARASLFGGAALLPRIALAGGENENDSGNHLQLTRGDREILIAAEIAEALAVTTYVNIINNAPFFTRLADDDQGYIMAALEEEMSHYMLEASATGTPTPFTTFYYPPGMFDSAQTTLNTLVTLEDAFIAAYLVGVRNFSTTALRVTAARIMGIESDHRTLARVVAPGVAALDGGPVEMVTGALGVAESVDPPNNNGYERTLKWTAISQAVTALTPFADPKAAAAAGFDTSRSFDFKPFTPTLPSALGDFISFGG